MRALRYGGSVVGLMALGMFMTGCANCVSSLPGGCKTGGGGGGTSSQTITVTFVNGTPLAVATQTGAGAFTTTTPGSQVTLTVGSGNVPYAITYVCPPLPGTTINLEFVIEATTQDATSFTANCQGSPNLGTVTGSASSSITGTADIEIRGAQGFGTNIGSASGMFPANTQLLTGANDVAAVAIDSSKNVLGVNIVRAQMSPGTINGGAGIFISSATTTQMFTVTGEPSINFISPPEASVTYNTANGTTFRLDNGAAANPQPYQAVPAAQAQATDFYSYESHAINPSTMQSIGISQTTTSGGGPFSLALPMPWSFSGPMPATLPTFTFVYSGFNGLTAVADQATIQWAPTATTLNQITVLATANFQGNATTITIPNLTVLSGFIAPATPGTKINWAAEIFGGTFPEFTVFPSPPSNGSLAFVGNQGSFTQP